MGYLTTIIYVLMTGHWWCLNRHRLSNCGGQRQHVSSFIGHFLSVAHCCYMTLSVKVYSNNSLSDKGWKALTSAFWVFLNKNNVWWMIFFVLSLLSLIPLSSLRVPLEQLPIPSHSTWRRGALLGWRWERRGGKEFDGTREGWRRAFSPHHSEPFIWLTGLACVSSCGTSLFQESAADMNE